MVKNYSSQNGSVFAVITVVLVIAIVGVLGLVLWQNFINKSDATNTNIAVNTPEDDTLTYRNESIGVEFTYPKEWIKLECNDMYVENPQNQVYFGTTNEGIAIIDGKSTQLCGGGSDFPPQMFFKVVDNSDEYAELGHISPFTNVKIDGKDARKSVTVAGRETIMSGLESTRYYIDINSTQHITIGYNRYPETNGGLRDNSESSRQKFVDVVEKSLRFL
ncbi:MAG TPA: hypothetical protein VFM68_03525 [Candidatus Saccharimonadales bacterium]|nr:hypothetical protein [Candidatus Saccharimonadales bacterium]